MKNTENLRERRAVSPVIATVILVAVAITVAVAVSYWMSGIAGQYTSFEKVSIKSAYASPKDNGTVFKGWVISLGLQNTGSSAATLESLFVNDKPISDYGFITGTSGPGKIRWTDTAPTPSDLWTDWDSVTSIASVSLDSGDEATIYVLVFGDRVSPAEGLFSAGTTINVKLHSANGFDYIKLVQLN